MKAIKIFDKETGLYASAGSYWSRVGKAWGNASGFICHLSAHPKKYDGQRYVVHVFEGTPSRELTVEDYRKEVAGRSHKKPRG